MTAREVKDALRRRHPATDEWGRPGQWTCLEEWGMVDLLAVNAWSAAPAAVAYEVKISRSDMRRELLKPHKRAAAVHMASEFWFAVPAGMLTPDELAYQEPAWEPADFQREKCIHGKPGWRPRRACTITVPVPAVLVDYLGGQPQNPTERHLEMFTRHQGYTEVPCPVCGGRGYTEKSRVERDAPTLWVPADAGLIEVHKSGTARVAKRAPRTKPDGPFASKQVRDLVRWASARPDPRHTERESAIA